MEVGLGLFVSVFVGLIVLIVLLTFLLLFKGGRFVKKTWAFIGVQLFTILHCIWRIVINGPNNILGKGVAILLILGVIGTVYLKDWKEEFLVARIVAVVLIFVSFFNLYNW